MKCSQKRFIFAPILRYKSEFNIINWNATTDKFVLKKATLNMDNMYRIILRINEDDAHKRTEACYLLLNYCGNKVSAEDKKENTRF